MKTLLALLCAAAIVLSLGLADAEAAAKKKPAPKNRDNYTAEQRKKAYEYAWKLCNKKYAMVERVEVNYKYNRIYCYAH